VKFNFIVVGVMFVDKVGVSLLQLRKFNTLSLIQILEAFDFLFFFSSSAEAASHRKSAS
jgi:hypothetical protein